MNKILREKLDELINAANEIEASIIYYKITNKLHNQYRKESKVAQSQILENAKNAVNLSTGKTIRIIDNKLFKDFLHYRSFVEEAYCNGKKPEERRNNEIN